MPFVNVAQSRGAVHNVIHVALNGLGDVVLLLEGSHVDVVPNVGPFVNADIKVF